MSEQVDQAAGPVEPRHSFYETEDKLTLEIFDKGANPDEVKVKLEPRALLYENGTSKRLALQPLKGEIDPEASTFTVGKVKIEIKLVKRAFGRWGTLEGESPDVLAIHTLPDQRSEPLASKPKPKKNWDTITTGILSAEKEKSMNEDPNVGGDATVNSFFQQLYGNADEDTRRAMMKSYIESNGTTLSTNWEEVKKGKVEGKAPQGSVMKKW